MNYLTTGLFSSLSNELVNYLRTTSNTHCCSALKLYEVREKVTKRANLIS